MLEKKKVIELKDGELDSVNGGYKKRTVTLYSFNKGECYSDQTIIYKVLDDNNDKEIDDVIICARYGKTPWIKHRNRICKSESTPILVSKLIEIDYEGIDYI